MATRRPGRAHRLRRALLVAVVAAAAFAGVRSLRGRPPAAGGPAGEGDGGGSGGPGGSGRPSPRPDAPTPPPLRAAAEVPVAVRERTVTWVAPTDDDPLVAPDGYPVKVNARSGIYHLPGGRNYERTRPDRWYRSAADAEADGFRAPKSF